MSSDIVRRSATEKIAIAFDIDMAETWTLDDVRDVLVQRIVELLNNSPERLMVMLYRIDVSEASVNEIFNTAFPPDVPTLLADLIVERQLQKAETRRAFAERAEQHERQDSAGQEEGQDS